MAARLTGLSFSRYRAFRDPQSLLLGRLNLVYGENNAGKSALLRHPALIAVSKAPGEPGLTLSGPPQGAGFRDVQWRGDIPSDQDPDLVLGVTLSDGADWRWTLQWSDLQAIATLHEVRIGDETEHETSAFDGLLPPPTHHFASARNQLRDALDGVVWLGATRDIPARGGFARGAPSSRLRTTTSAARQVAADAELREAVSAWFLKNANVGIEVEALGGDLQRLVVQPKGARFAVPFTDVGEGLGSAFSVIAALEELRQKGGFLCIEEPESHLHPKLEQALAELVIDVLTKQPRAAVMLETHSEVFLLAALTAALGALPATDVRIHWVETVDGGAACVEPIELDEAGRPNSDRFEHAFAVMGAMRRNLVAARRIHGG